MNFVDHSDDRTVLDYVQKEMDRYADSQDKTAKVQFDVLHSYYDLLRKHGAKHRAELTPH